MARATPPELIEAARTIERLTGVPPTIRPPRSRKEKREEAERVRRFLALPPELQEGALRYAERIREVYLLRET